MLPLLGNEYALGHAAKEGSRDGPAQHLERADRWEVLAAEYGRRAPANT
jgi:hypothetical protein